jgi:maltooligosyltrehalose synthase
MTQMGIIPTIAYDANFFISPGLGTTDEHGQLIQERARMIIRGLVLLIEIVCNHAGIFE